MNFDMDNSENFALETSNFSLSLNVSDEFNLNFMCNKKQATHYNLRPHKHMYYISVYELTKSQEFWIKSINS